MKKVLFCCLLATAGSFFQPASAKIFRVGYSGPQVNGTDYGSLQPAVTAALAGDTIQLYQNASISSATVNKRLVFIGMGYRLEHNPGLQATSSVTNYGTIYFQTGSDNCVVQGVLANIYIGANNISISRSTGTYYIGHNGNNSNVATNNVAITSSYASIYATYGDASNVLVSNNILDNGDLRNTSGLIMNNLFRSYSYFGANVVKNNIFAQSSSIQIEGSAVFQNNILSYANPGLTGSNNLFNVSMATVFVDYSGWTGSAGADSKLMLKAGSPAIGFGINNSNAATDAGIFGGEPGYVYKPAGIPPVPSIYQLSAPQLNASTNPYTITIGVRSNN